MARYQEHPSRSSRWSSGQLEVHPDAQRADFTTWFSIKVSSDQEQTWEGLLSIKTSPSTSRIVAVPALAYDVGFGDEVEIVNSDEGAAVATRVLANAGMSTFRVLFTSSERSDEDERISAFLSEIRPIPCVFDVYSERLVSLSVEPENCDALMDILAQGSSIGLFEFERSKPVTGSCHVFGGRSDQ